MKAELIFNLPEDQNEFKMAVEASDMAIAIWDFKQYLRNELKYKCDDKSIEYIEALDAVQEKFFEILGEFEYE